ncbi:hypothetical protein IIC38_13475 [candidate division KSB1 bacterium]|nr:hypothetical protein [candidate division KSB1 bacterium]
MKRPIEEELTVLHRLPNSRLDCRKNMEIKVGPSSTIRVSHNIYSVHSRLIGEIAKVRLYSKVNK